MSVGYHLLAAESNSLISGAISHSGFPLFDGHISTLAESEQGTRGWYRSFIPAPVLFIPNEPLYKVLDKMSQALGKKVDFGNMESVPPEELFASYEESRSGATWGPIPNDGLFYRDNAFEKLAQGKSDSKKPFLVGSVSFDGSSFIRDTKFTHDNFKTKVFGHLRKGLLQKTWCKSDFRSQTEVILAAYGTRISMLATKMQ